MAKKYRQKYAEYARLFGCSLKTIKRWAKKDYPLDDPAAMATKLGDQKSAPDGAVERVTIIAGKEERVSQSTQVRLSKTQLEADTLAFKLSVLKGEYTENAKVREDITRIATALRSMLLRMENDLPGVLAGLDEVAIQRKVREHSDKIMESLSDATSSLYLPIESPTCPP